MNFKNKIGYLIPCAIESCLSTMVSKGLIKSFDKDPSPLIIEKGQNQATSLIMLGGYHNI